MSKPNTPAIPTPARGPKHRNRRSEPNPLGGNFILMPSLLEYLSPDLTLPEQYFGRQRNDDGMGAEKSLMYAVLKDGIRCFYKHVGATRRKYRKMSAEAEEWLMEDDFDYPFAFRFICDTLGIDAGCLRQRLMTWKEQELERRRVTGDTKSIQVGRSPFPAPIVDHAGPQGFETAAPAEDEDFDEFDEAARIDDVEAAPVQTEAASFDALSPATESAAATTTAATEGLSSFGGGGSELAAASSDTEDEASSWGGFEHVSLEQLALDEVA